MSRDPVPRFSSTCSFRVVSRWLVLWLFQRRGHFKPSTKMKDGGGVNLRYSRFHDTDDMPDLFHGDIFVVVEGHDKALALGQRVDRIGQTFSHLSIQVAEKRIV